MRINLSIATRRYNMLAQFTVHVHGEGNSDEDIETLQAFLEHIVEVINHTTYQAKLVEPVFDNDS